MKDLFKKINIMYVFFIIWTYKIFFLLFYIYVSFFVYINLFENAENEYRIINFGC